MIDAVLIYVALPDEEVQVWRPIQAERLRDNIYLIVDQPYDRDIERWEFEPGEMVYCELVLSSDGPILTAVGRA